MIKLPEHMQAAYLFAFSEALRYGNLAKICQSPDFNGNRSPGFWINEARKRLREATAIRLGFLVYV